MAYVTKGHLSCGGTINADSSSAIAKRELFADVQVLDDNSALYATLKQIDSLSEGKYEILLYSCTKNSNNIGEGKFTIKELRTDIIYEHPDEYHKPIHIIQTDIYMQRLAGDWFSGSIPIFRYDDIKGISAYSTQGDTSSAIKDVSTKWNIYIDGTKNPLYKLTWDCASVPTSDTSKVKVLFCASDDTVANTYIVKGTHYYDYNNKSVKLNYHDIHEAVWGDMGGLVKGAVTIIVQFEYFDTTTVVPKDTSSYMYCELFPSEQNGHMYGDIGFCKVGEHSTWFVKTDSGDGSTFTAHDGTGGSDGYTKDDDKGYEDNKDKDDDDDDTHVLSSGIGVLTSTFHMTKERLVQLGQFLWGSSIFDEFSLINNNPIENIISCKAIPYAISGTTQEITLGNVKTGVNGEKISQNFSKQTIGSVAIAEHYHNFLDYAPYTNVIIYLPYIGFKELDASLVMGKTLKIDLVAQDVL